MTIEYNGRAMVLASFVADSLALGAHWIYDAALIEKQFGKVDRLMKPRPESYHAGKNKGDFTHYGDQAFVLLESVALKKGFDLKDFATRWKKLFEDYEGYFDQATQVTLHNQSKGKDIQEAGSHSNDIAGSARIAPLVYCYRGKPDLLVHASKLQTMMTHNDPLVIESAEFFSRVCLKVLNGESPTKAMEDVGEERFIQSPLYQWLKAGIESRQQESIDSIIRFGQSCHVDEAFPGVIQLIAKYENNLKEGLVQNVMAGGDSAARGMIVGMVLGAHQGLRGIPEEWVSELNRREQILKLLDAISEAS